MKTNDRDLALHVGRALEAQHFFHDVTYDYRLRDNPDDIYQFQRSIATKLIARNGYANGVSTFNMDDSNSNSEQARFGSELASELKHNANRLSQHGQSQSRSQCIMTIVNELSNAASNGEQRRQEIISDIIHTEQKFMDALETIKRVYIEPFRYANIISDPIELDAFIENVFYNIPTIRQTSAQLLQALIERQNENTTVERIGDIFLAHVDKLEPFVSYAAHRPYALHHLDTAVKKYDELLRWLEERKRMPEVHGIPIHWFLAQPTARLARYPLYLKQQ
ncbi:Dbl homology domain-containing protein [Syncephalis plumigaleata]|nr:Dbl homology domain-containing protein [Syncephalis plumigaleata]